MSVTGRQGISAIASHRPGITQTIPPFVTTSKGSAAGRKAAGVDAIEIHQSVFEKILNGDLDPGMITRAQKSFLGELGMTVTACNINTWSNPKFRLGGPCNPDPAMRKAALEEVLKGVEICRIMKIPVLSVWPGSDGADYHFQIDYRESIGGSPRC